MQVNIPESSLPTSVAWPQAQWLHEEVTAWIQAVVNPSAAVEGPLAIYNEKAWGITARFQCGSEQIVFKGCQLPLFAPRLATEALLAQHCAAHVPDYVAGRLLPNQETWTLYRYCAGVAVDKSDNSENTLPFFSLFRLLEAADDFVTVPEELVRTEGPLLLTPNQMAVRNAYLAQLPWQNRTTRARF
ncbi:MAG: hypothetical protein R2867_06085 [Caldilineaceae bacterium]